MSTAFGLAALNEFGIALANHVWQSTLFAVAVFILMPLFRKNRAVVRQRLWQIASLKFLFPFSLLIGLGGQLGSQAVPSVPSSALPVVIRQIGVPFAVPSMELLSLSPPSAAPHRIVPVAAIFLTVWVLGAGVVILIWFFRWSQVARMMRLAEPFRAAGQNSLIPILSSSAAMEPGVFGILRPVLWIPESASRNLSEAQLQGIIAHEMSHVRGNDNLFAAAHTLVEALFWFHPVVWWLGSRLLDERERVCDEAVLEMGMAADVYAEAILNICKTYTAAPACVAGFGASNLKRRIEGIVNYQGKCQLTVATKLTLAVAGMGILLSPLWIGMTQASEPQKGRATLAKIPVYEVGSKMAAATVGQVATRAPVPPSSSLQNWADSEVFSIISRAESDAFSLLRSDEQRAIFVEMFWEQWDPTPGTPANEFRDEFNRRIKYANEHFTQSSGTPGYRTDRGRMFTANGPPDEVETHPAGVAGTLPYETWLYRHLDARGDNLSYEFVDIQRNGDYRLQYDPSVKELK